MYARTTEVRIQRGKLAEFTDGIESILPALRKQRGFRALLVLRGSDPASLAATIISIWDSLQDLKLSESNLFLYQALARLLATSESFPRMTEHEVLLSEFAAD
jgi:heme-degrading monooxygenase HmoA